MSYLSSIRLINFTFAFCQKSKTRPSVFTIARPCLLHICLMRVYTPIPVQWDIRTKTQQNNLALLGKGIALSPYRKSCIGGFCCEIRTFLYRFSLAGILRTFDDYNAQRPFTRMAALAAKLVILPSSVVAYK